MATAYTIATGVDKIYRKMDGEYELVLLHMARCNPTASDTLTLTSAWTAGRKVIDLKAQDYSAATITFGQATGATTVVATSEATCSFVRATGIITFGGAADSTDFYVKFKLVNG